MRDENKLSKAVSTSNSSSQRATAILAGGAIIIGAVLHFSVISFIPSWDIKDTTKTTLESNDYELDSYNQFQEKVKADSKFNRIKSDLKAPKWTEEMSRGNSTFEEYVDSQPLHELYPIVPGWSELIEAKKTRDEISAKMGAQVPTAVLKFEFESTCQLVDDLDAGLDISQADSYDEEHPYKGKYFGGAGSTPENFETFLKGCGDTSLKHLDALKKEAEKIEQENAESDKQLQEMLNELDQSEQK